MVDDVLWEKKFGRVTNAGGVQERCAWLPARKPLTRPRHMGTRVQSLVTFIEAGHWSTELFFFLLLQLCQLFCSRMLSSRSSLLRSERSNASSVWLLLSNIDTLYQPQNSCENQQTLCSLQVQRSLQQPALSGDIGDVHAVSWDHRDDQQEWLSGPGMGSHRYPNGSEPQRIPSPPKPKVFARVRFFPRGGHPSPA